MDSLSHFYAMRDFPLNDGSTIKEVTGKTGPVTCQ
jgi:hypothetical protein